jgi:hypothetical protein
VKHDLLNIASGLFSDGVSSPHIAWRFRPATSWQLSHKLVAVEQNSRNNFSFFAEIAARFLHKLRRSLHYGMTRRLRRSIWLGVKAAIQRPTARLCRRTIPNLLAAKLETLASCTANSVTRGPPLVGPSSSSGDYFSERRTVWLATQY